MLLLDLILDMIGFLHDVIPALLQLFSTMASVRTRVTGKSSDPVSREVEALLEKMDTPTKKSEAGSACYGSLSARCPSLHCSYTCCLLENAFLTIAFIEAAPGVYSKWMQDGHWLS